MKKVLFVATVVQKHINVFHLPFLKMFQEAGWETSVCARNDFENKEDCIIPNCDKYYDMPFERNPFKANNLKVFQKLKALIKQEKYDIIHCHTPTGGVLARFAAFASGNKSTRVIYTAHGFHFFKGAPLLNWLLYFPVEWFCSFFTDTLITINQEDYAFAQKHMHAKEIRYVPGVGLDTEKFVPSEEQKRQKRIELQLPEDAYLIMSVGELTQRKNHETVIKVMEKIKIPNCYYLIVGGGEKEEYLKKIAVDTDVKENIIFLGRREDVDTLCCAADVFCFLSFQEGLPVALMEAMAAGLPCVASSIRGNVDLIQDGRNGILVSPTDVNDAKCAIETLLEDESLRLAMRENNMEDIKAFDFENVGKIMMEIYGI